jgi:phosphatidylserine/phosphatidylglycerophosphate/cardiolipin synthase-like enzyme
VLHTLPDEGERPFVDALRSAVRQIDVMVYMMGFGGILDTLTEKARAGVKVTVLLDGNEKRSVNQKYQEILTAAGAIVRWSDPAFAHMHAKVLMVDGEVAVLSTGNYARSFMLQERNYAITDRDPEDLRSLQELFRADVEGRAPNLQCTRLVVAPVNAKMRMLELVKSATRSLVVHSMQFAERDIQEAVLERKRAGVDVRVLLADAEWIDANAQAGRVLRDASIPARQLRAPSVHVKAIVADGARVFVGSENLSYTSLTRNREVGVMTDQPEVAKRMLDVFDEDWRSAVEF